MRVAFLSPGWPPSAFANGIVTYIQLLRGGLDGLGVETRVLTPRLEGSGHGSSVVDLRSCETRFPLVERVRRRAIAQLAPHEAVPRDMAAGILRGLDELDRRSPIDVLEMEESFGTAGIVGRRARVPLVVRLHGPWFLNGAALGAPRDESFHRRVAFEGKTIEHARALTSPSAELLKSVREEYELELAHAEVIHNPAPIVDEASRWRLDECDPNTILFVGRFDRHKGGDLVLEAFARVAPKRPELRLVFIGPDRGLEDGHGGRVSLRDYLDTAIPDLAIRGRVEHLGQVPATEIPSWRRRARVTIVASRFEVFPMVTLEAIAFGSPLVAARAGGIPEIVDHERTGFLFERGDPEDLAHWLDAMLDDPARSARLGEEAAKDAVVRFGPDAIARQMKSYYERVIAESGS